MVRINFVRFPFFPLIFYFYGFVVARKLTPARINRKAVCKEPKTAQVIKLQELVFNCYFKSSLIIKSVKIAEA